MSSSLKNINFISYNNTDDITIIPYINSNIIINNTLKIPNTHDEDGLNNELSIRKNSNAYIQLKDQNDGNFKTIYLNDNSIYFTPSSNNIPSESTRIITNNELQNEIEILSSDVVDPLVFSNIFLSNTGILNFLNSNTYDVESNNIIGFTQINGDIYFRNSNNSEWISLETLGGNATSILGYPISISNISNNHILIYNNDTGNFNNTEFKLLLDKSPQLGNDLNANNYSIQFNNSSNGITDEFNNSLIKFNSNNSNDSNTHLIISHKGDKMPLLTVDGNISNIDLNIESKNADINLNSDDLNISASNIYMSNLINMQFNSGFITESIYTITENLPLSTSIISPTIIEPSDGIILFNISGNNTNYYANIKEGINGQKLNLIYESNGSNNSLTLEFSYSNGSVSKIGTGSGLHDNLIFNTPGQGSTLVYLGNLNNRSRWQVLNTGGSVV